MSSQYFGTFLVGISPGVAVLGSAGMLSSSRTFVMSLHLGLVAIAVALNATTSLQPESRVSPRTVAITTTASATTSLEPTSHTSLRPVQVSSIPGGRKSGRGEDEGRDKNGPGKKRGRVEGQNEHHDDKNAREGRSNEEPKGRKSGRGEDEGRDKNGPGKKRGRVEGQNEHHDDKNAREGRSNDEHKGRKSGRGKDEGRDKNGPGKKRGRDEDKGHHDHEEHARDANSLDWQKEGVRHEKHDADQKWDQGEIDQGNNSKRHWLDGPKEDRKSWRSDADDRKRTHEKREGSTGAENKSKRSQVHVQEWQKNGHNDKRRDDATRVQEGAKGEEDTQTRGVKDAEDAENRFFAEKAGVLVAVALMLCLVFCAFTVGIAFLAFRLGRKERELRSVYAMSPNAPMPHVTGAPVNWQNDADQKVAEP